MKFYPISILPLTGTTFEKVNKKVRQIFRALEKQTKRKPYKRSAFFNKDKIFFDYFFLHLNQKDRKTKTERLKYFPCALELIEKSTFSPELKKNTDKNEKNLYRFAGITPQGKKFIVQIKEEKNRNKYLMSVFEYNKKIF